MKIPFTGGCACGAIRYECTGEPIMMFKCHCRDCQKLTSGGFAPAVIVPAQAFRLTRGQLRHHFTLSIGRGRHRRGFCPECGSLVTGGEFEERSKSVGILAGTLDDPSWFQPQMDIFVSDAQPMGPNGPGDSEIRAVSVMIDKEINNDAKSHSVFVVRSSGRRSGEVLRVHFQKFERILRCSKEVDKPSHPKM